MEAEPGGRGPNSKNQKMGTLRVSRSISKARLEGGGEASASTSPREPGGREPAKPDSWFQSVAVHLESAYHSVTLESVALQRKITRTGGGGCGVWNPSFPQVWGPKRRCGKDITPGFLRPQISGPVAASQALGMGPQGNHTFPGLTLLLKDR